MVTKSAYVLEPCKHQLSTCIFYNDIHACAYKLSGVYSLSGSLDNSFRYKVAVGVICAGMVLLVLLFIIMILYIVASRRKQLKPVGKLSIDCIYTTIIDHDEVFLHIIYT